LEKPRFCEVTAASAPDAETWVETLPRSTRAVGGAGAVPPHAAVVAAITRASDAAAAIRTPRLLPRMVV
jgi:hypothetical protein